MRQKLLASLLLIALAPLPARAAEAPPHGAVAVPAGFDYGHSRGRYLLLLNVDALNERVFREMLDRGELPNMERVIREKQGRVGRLLSSFPSSSAPAIPEIFNGRYLDRSETLPRKVHAFDRGSRQSMRYTFKDRDWVDDQVDIWDICRAGGLPTLSFYLRAYDGVSQNRFHRQYLAWDSLFEYLKMSRVMNFDRRSLKDAARVFRKTVDLPRLSYLWCDTLDTGGHIYGPYSPQYRRGLEQIDEGFGWVLAAMRSRSVPPEDGGGTFYDHCSFMIYGDHGLSSSAHKVDVDRYLRSEGLKLRDTSHVSQFISEYLGRDWAARVDAIFVPGGSSVAELYIRPGVAGKRAGTKRPWTERLARAELERLRTPRHPEGVNLLQALAALPGVDFVVVKEKEAPDRSVRIVSADRGEALVILREEAGGDTYAYVPLDSGGGQAPALRGGDPLDYELTALTRPLVSRLDGAPRFATAREWLHASVGTTHPFAVPRLPRAFGTHATESDIVLVAHPGHDFLAHSRGDHGGLDPETMITPLVIADGAPHAHAEPPLLCTVDMMPTMLEILGIRAPLDYAACLDGVMEGSGTRAAWVARGGGAGGAGIGRAER